MAQLFVKIPKERIGVLIGVNGSVKNHIEEKLGVKLDIDSETGDVTITLKEKAEDPTLIFRAKDTVMAIGRGFSPERAFKLLENEDYMLEIIDLRDIFGKSEAELRRVKGRIIGRNGRTREIIEEMSETIVSVYGHTVAIIGDAEQVSVAREAVNLLIGGSTHSTVYKFLQRKRQELKRRRLELWEDRSLLPGHE
ncbi:RNA-processing protein [Candidatus Bathyarchaeota archaeon]|nr:RNA-processing protein [Candidatus Bathyarchaeota archaeon]